MTESHTDPQKALPERDLRGMIESQDILEDYAKPHSQVDSGNLFYAACTFRDEVLRLEPTLEAATARCKELDLEMRKTKTAVGRLRSIVAERDEYRRLAEEWMKDYQALKDKYEPMELVTSEALASGRKDGKL